MNAMKIMLNRMQKATSKALGGSQRLNTPEVDPDIRMYNKLTPQHFHDLRSRFGDHAVTEYIKSMELRKMKGG